MNDETRQFESLESRFFEGAEKKVEIVIDNSMPALRSAGDEYWSRMVAAAGAHILSKIHNDHCDAYLLSESSLFVFDHKLVMITCGQTRLVEAVALLMQRVPASGVDFFIYERKNEVYPHRQPTSFYDDARKLGKMLPGKAFRFGDEDEHHILLYQLDRSYSGPQPDLTLEMLMYGIDESIRGAFERGDAGHVRERLGLADLVSGFLLDDYLFEPSGYSINGIRGDEYWTLHVTPESNGSYVSFETNLRNGEELAPVTGMLLELFQPRSFDVFLFRQREEIQLEPRHYRLRSHVCGDLSCGYQVSFRSFHRPETRPRPPAEILVT